MKNSVVTAYHIYATMKHLLTFPERYSSKGSYDRSLLEPVPQFETCEALRIPQDTCLCEDYIPLPADTESTEILVTYMLTEHKEAKQIATFVLDWMQNFNDDKAHGLCRTFRLKSVKSIGYMLKHVYQCD
jgi:hypothetical protein